MAWHALRNDSSPAAVAQKLVVAMENTATRHRRELERLSISLIIDECHKKTDTSLKTLGFYLTTIYTAGEIFDSDVSVCTDVFIQARDRDRAFSDVKMCIGEYLYLFRTCKPCGMIATIDEKSEYTIILERGLSKIAIRIE